MTAPRSQPPSTAGAHASPIPDPPLSEQARAPSHAERARTLVAGQTTGTLSTLDPDGFPHGSYVAFALDGPDVVFLVSSLATHTQHLDRDPRASLLVHETKAEDPLANGRVTLLGRCEKVSDPTAAREAFLAAHPRAIHYVDLADFGFYRLTVGSARYIGGFGRMSWIDADAWREARADPLAADAEAILRHMNDDHGDALVHYARAFTRAESPTDAVMTGIDRHGFELSVGTPTGRRAARVAFPGEVTTKDEARRVLVALAKEARARVGGG